MAVQVQEITQKSLAVYWHGKVVDVLSTEEALKKVKDCPHHHRIVKDPKTGKYAMVVCQ